MKCAVSKSEVAEIQLQMKRRAGRVENKVTLMAGWSDSSRGRRMRSSTRTSCDCEITMRADALRLEVAEMQAQFICAGLEVGSC